MRVWVGVFVIEKNMGNVCQSGREKVEMIYFYQQFIYQ